MYKEISCYDKDTTEHTVTESIFTALKHDFHGVSVPAYYLPLAKDLIPDGFVVASSVDYPGGLSSTGVRCHSSINIIRAGANAVDLVANSNLLVNRKFKKFKEDIEANYKICQDNNCSLRVMFEYRIYDKNSLILAACDIIRSVGVDYIFPSTGSMVDDIEDSIVVGFLLQKKKEQNVIFNANIWRKEDYEKVENSGVFGIRIKSRNAVKNIFGVL